MVGRRVVRLRECIVVEKCGCLVEGGCMYVKGFFGLVMNGWVEIGR